MPDTDLFTPCALWAPSGRVLSCEGESERHPQRNGIYTIRASDGKGLTRVTKNPDGGIDSPLAYSPDGGRLLFDRSDPSRRQTASHALFVAPVSGGSPTRITPWGYTDDNAGWSPDGGTVVFGTNGSLYRVSPSGAHLSRIPLGAGPNGDAIANAFDVSFSPNGRRIVFSVGLPAPRPGIYIAQVDGGDVTPLATSSTEDHHATWGPSTSG